jgi:capsid protein
MSRLRTFFRGVSKVAYSTFFEGANISSAQRTYIYPTVTDHPREANNFTRNSMTAVSRYLTANLGVVRGIYRDMALYSNIGKPQSQSASRGWAEEAEVYWLNATKILDITGRHDWDALQFLLDFSMDRDGDIGLILTDGSFPQVQVIESHRIDDCGKGDSTDGVVMNRVGRPVAYRVKIGDDGEFIDIPAAAFIHYFEPDRATACRGISALHAGLNSGRDIADIVSFLKTTVKLESGVAILKQTKTGEASYNDWGANATATDTTSPTGKILQDLYGARVERFAEGEDIKSLATDRPSPNVEQFLEFLIRDISTGMGLPPEFTWNSSKLSGPSMRFVMAKAQRRIEQRQRLKMRIGNRLWGWVIAKGAKRGDIAQLPEDWWKVRWQTPSAITIDVGREAAQDRADLQAGAITFTEFLGKQGIDFDDHLNKRIEEARKITEAVKASGVDMNLVYMPTANGNPSTNQQQKPQDTNGQRTDSDDESELQQK